METLSIDGKIDISGIAISAGKCAASLFTAAYLGLGIPSFENTNEYFNSMPPESRELASKEYIQDWRQLPFFYKYSPAYLCAYVASAMQSKE